MEGGARKREVPEGSDWLTLEVPTPFKCEICSRAFASQHALGGHYNAHRGAKIQEESRRHMAAQLRAMWRRQTLLLLRTVVGPPPTMVHDLCCSVPNKGKAKDQAKKRKVVHGGASSSGPGSSSETDLNLELKL